MQIQSQKTFQPDIPAPFIFNPLKHHLLFICETVNFTWDNREQLSEKLQRIESIGLPATDVYSGNLGVHTILKEMETILRMKQHWKREQYLQWINSVTGHYQFLTLSDSSRWVLRTGEKPERHIHFHPAKHSPLSFRVRGATLRTALAVLTQQKHPEKYK